MIHDLDLHLPAVRVASQAQLDPQLGSSMKRIWIVGQQNIGDVAPNHWLHAGQHRRAISLVVPLALVIDTDHVECASLPAQLDVFLAQQFHPKFLKKLRGLFFSPRVDLMVSVAAPDAQRRAQPRKLRDAVFERVRPAGQKIAGDDG